MWTCESRLRPRRGRISQVTMGGMAHTKWYHHCPLPYRPAVAQQANWSGGTTVGWGNSKPLGVTHTHDTMVSLWSKEPSLNLRDSMEGMSVSLTSTLSNTRPFSWLQMTSKMCSGTNLGRESSSLGLPSTHSMELLLAYVTGCVELLQPLLLLLPEATCHIRWKGCLFYDVKPWPSSAIDTRIGLLRRGWQLEGIALLLVDHQGLPRKTSLSHHFPCP